MIGSDEGGKEGCGEGGGDEGGAKTPGDASDGRVSGLVTFENEMPSFLIIFVGKWVWAERNFVNYYRSLR